jgi:hypothetical protein
VPLREVWQLWDEVQNVALRLMPFGVLAVELNGFQGAQNAVMERVSSGTHAVSAYWNVNMHTAFTCAVDGEVFVSGEYGCDGPYHLDDLGAGLPNWNETSTVGRMFALMARLTGQVFAPEWLEGEFLSVPLAAEIERVRQSLGPSRDKVSPEREHLNQADPALAQALRTADEETLRRVARVAAAYAVAQVGLAEEPAVVQALNASPLQFDGLEALAAGMADESSRTPPGDAEARPRRMRMLALKAVQEASNPDALSAVYRTIKVADKVGRYEHNYGIWTVVRKALADPEPPTGSAGAVSEAGAGPIARHEWITGHWLGPAGAVVLVRTRDLAAVARAYEGDPARSVVGPLPSTPGPHVLGLRQEGEWTVAIQSPEVYRGYEEPLSELSRGTEAICVYWNLADSVPRLFAYANGEVQTKIDIYSGGCPGMLDPGPMDLFDPLLVVLGVNRSDVGRVPVVLALAEQLTGIAIIPEWLDSLQLVPQVVNRRVVRRSPDGQVVQSVPMDFGAPSRAGGEAVT